ncbi:MAG TPA: hypothetical protein C5S37_12845, partial [Methanophagales archaeon]|nr:hypothetical protein [Methanophagales archaeon]
MKSRNILGIAALVVLSWTIVSTAATAGAINVSDKGYISPSIAQDTANTLIDEVYNRAQLKG